MGLKLLFSLFIIYVLSNIFDLIGWLALLFYLITMFLLLPLIHFINKTANNVNETKNFFKYENSLLTPGIKKRGFFKTLSKVSYNDFIDDKEANLSSITPFPSRRIEDVMDEIIAEIIKYYVLPYSEANNWKFKTTEVFLKKFLKKFISEIVHRMSVIEWNIFLCNTLLDNTRSHLSFLKSRSNQNRENTFFMGPKTENLFVEAISNRLLRSLLDGRYIQCELVYQFCLGLLSHQVIKRSVEYACEPSNHNRWLFRWLLERKIIGTKLSRQLPHFQYDMSFEDFFKLVESINDLNEVKQIRQKLVSELRMAEVLRYNQSNMDSKSASKKQGQPDPAKTGRKTYKGHLLSQRDLKCYSNQLSILLDTVDTKLKIMTKGKVSVPLETATVAKSKRYKSNRRPSTSEKQTLTKKFRLKVAGNFTRGKRTKSINEKSSTINECIPFETIMDSTEGRKFFKDFLNNTTYSRTVELIEMLAHLQNQPENQYLIAQGIVKRYIHSSPPAFDFDKQLVKEMEEFLKGNSNEKVFLKAKAICDKELKQRWYPYFVLSPQYGKFSKYHSKEMSSMESMKMMDISPPGMSTDTGDSDLDSDESEVPTNIENIMAENEVDDDNRPLLYDFAQNLDKPNLPEESEVRGVASQLEELDNASKKVSEISDGGHTDEDYEEEEDGFLKPYFEEINPLISGNETLEYYHQKIRRLNKKIEVKEKAYDAGVAVSNQMPLSKKEKSKMKLDLSSVKEDLNRLYDKRKKCQYNLTRIDKWMISMGNWNARVYDVVLPEPKRGTSLDLGYLPTLTESKVGTSGVVDKDDISLDDDSKQVLIFIMVSLASIIDQSGEDNGWLVKHTLKEFHTLKRDLSSISPVIDKINLPKVPQRLFLRRKYTDNDLSHIKDSLNKFIMFVMKTPSLAKSETVFKFFCSSLDIGNAVPNDDSLIGPLSSLANTLSDASAKVMLMAKIPSKFVQKVLAPRKHSGSVTSLDSETSDSKSDRKSAFRRISGSSHVGGSLKHKLRKFSRSKDISMSAFELLEELIQLRKSMTLTRRSMITFVQSFFGKNLTQILTEKVAWIKSESTVFLCLQKYRDSFRIDVLTSSIQSSLETTLVAAPNQVGDLGECRLHPSASAFITPPVSEPSESNLAQVNSNSSPTMHKARFYQHSSPIGVMGPGGGSCENIACCAGVGTGPSTTGAPVKEPPVSSATAEAAPKATGIRFDQSWSYSVQCDEAVKRLLWESVPEYWKTLFGAVSVSDSVGFVFESLQSLPANKALVYKVLQSFVDELLEEDDEPLYLTM